VKTKWNKEWETYIQIVINIFNILAEKVKEILLEYELSLIHSFNYTPQEYLHNLNENIDDV